MSMEEARRCAERIKSDTDFRDRVMAREGMDARMALIAAEGFDCTVEELHAMQEEEEHMFDGVAGGGCDNMGSGPCYTQYLGSCICSQGYAH